MKRIFTFFSALLILAIGGVIAFEMQAAAKKLPVRQYFPASKTVAVWDWHNPAARSSNDLKQLDQFFYLHQINTVYVDIGSYTDIYKSNDTSKKQQLETALANYINAVKEHHVRVFASAGNTDWSKPTQRDIPIAIQNFVFSYNSRHPNAKLSGLEFDIESYNQTGFPDASATEKTIVLTELLDTVKAITTNQNAHHSKIELGFAIPYWFDDENGNIPSITWNSKTGPTLYHVADTLNTVPSSNLVVMAYRNAASGNDGSIFHSRTEVEYAQSKTQHVKVLVGQEVNDVQPAKITFYGMSISEFSGEVGLINDAFKDNSAYGGVAINDLPGLMQMDSITGKLL